MIRKKSNKPLIFVDDVVDVVDVVVVDSVELLEVVQDVLLLVTQRIGSILLL